MCDALDMFPCGNEIYIISKSNIVRLYRIRIAYISTKEAKMEQNKNLLREEAINFAIEVSDICDDIKG